MKKRLIEANALKLRLKRFVENESHVDIDAIVREIDMVPTEDEYMEDDGR